MNNKRIFRTASLALAVMLSASSCGYIEMRDSTPAADESEAAVTDDGSFGLEQSVLINDPIVPDETEAAETAAEEAAVTEETVTEETVADTADETESDEQIIKVVAVGDSLFTDDVISYASKQAESSEDKDYSFFLMYSNIFKSVSSADVALATCSSDVVADFVMTPYTEPADENTADAAAEGDEAKQTDSQSESSGTQTEETAETTESTEPTVTPTGGIPLDAVEALVSLGIDAFDVTGQLTKGTLLASSINLYDANGLITCGAYKNEDDYNSIRIIRKDEVNIALLSLSDYQVSGTNIIIPGFDDTDALKSWVEYADFNSDIVIITADWGDMTEDEIKSAALTMAEAGADIIIGCGDTVGSVEWIDTNDSTETLCVYSIGNLLDTKDTDSLSSMLSFSIVKGEGYLAIQDVKLTPVLTYSDSSTIQVLTIDAYRTLLTAKGMSTAQADDLQSRFDAIVPGEFR